MDLVCVKYVSGAQGRGKIDITSLENVIRAHIEAFWVVYKI